jgi:hypothetical protein
MALIAGQVQVSGTVPVVLVPPGGGHLVLATVSGTAYVGLGSFVSTSSGFPVTTAPFAVATFTDSAGTRLYATVTSGTVALGWFLSTAA